MTASIDSVLGLLAVLVERLAAKLRQRAYADCGVRAVRAASPLDLAPASRARPLALKYVLCAARRRERQDAPTACLEHGLDSPQRVGACCNLSALTLLTPYANLRQHRWPLLREWPLRRCPATA